MNKLRIIGAFAILVNLLLTACQAGNMQTASLPADQIAMPVAYPQTADNYLQAAKTTSPADSNTAKLQAAGRLIQDGEINRAKQIIAKLANTDLTATQQAEKTLLQSKLALRAHHPKTAAKKLITINATADLDQTQQAIYYHLLAESYARSHQVIKAAKAYIQLNDLLPANSQYANQLAIWHNLQHISASKLQQLLTSSSNRAMLGYARLLEITRTFQQDSEGLARSIEQWQANNPQHPFNTVLNRSRDRNLADIAAPNKVALLVPISGKYASAGKAIRDGFMAAYFKQHNPDLQIKVYDTATTPDVNTLYQQALQNGAEFVVGPLRKTTISQLVDGSKLAVPTLVLNNDADWPSNGRNLYQFALSPQAEASQVADRAWQQGYRKALVITPNNAWSAGIRQQFINRWRARGGIIVSNLQYAPKDNISNLLKDALHIKQSQQRARAMRSIIGKKPKYIARRRHDIDMIFMLASPAKAKSIKPLLRFYYAGKIPVFSTSWVYKARSNGRDSDLNGVAFSEIPFLIPHTAANKNYQHYRREIPRTVKQSPRLFALGEDAFTLSLQLPRLLAYPWMNIAGQTGSLSIAGHRVLRRVSWGEIRRGRVTKL